MSASDHAPLLQPLRFTLHGSRLIEASAGTGKTFTIAALYLRLVLGHGGADGFGRALSPPEILVVTYTDAATQELRDRIRARLAQAAEVFEADPAGVAPRPQGEDLLHDLRADVAPDQWPACARRLRLAAESMDQAAVSTIHGWCHRMLREHAFDSGHLFTQALQADQSELLAEAVRDYWRVHLATLPLDDARLLRTHWATPDALQQDTEPLLSALAQMDDGPAPARSLARVRDQRDQRLVALKAPWPRWADELQTWLDEASDKKGFDGRKLRPDYYQPWLNGLRQWAADASATQPVLSNAAWSRLTPQGIAEVCKAGVTPLDHPALEAMLTLRTQLQALPDGRAEVLAHAVRWVAQRLAQEQQRRAEMGFHELLTHLDAALRGPNGPRLAATIRAQFPVALIDEFQDTDPLQYRIFDTVYSVAANAPDTALVLIGDPKQAIYAFRGADIHTYLRARTDTAGRHATLGTNHRSTQAMVRAVNHVFEQAERRTTGQGAFGFRRQGVNGLPFHGVAARGRDDRWVVDGHDGAALVAWTFGADSDKPLSVGAARQRLAQACATEITRLLRGGQAGQAGFVKDGEPLRPVRPADMAVLVHSGSEARAVREALRQRGVRSVYLSDKESVFQAAVVGDVLRWLRACAEPDDDRALRVALATSTLAQSWSALDQLQHDEWAWEQRVLQFRALREVWQRQGVLPMLRQLLQAFGVPQRLLGQGDERTLTDVLHLAELLQHASATLDGEHALIRWLAQQRVDPDAPADAQRLRLESDADLVQVVTVHKSKGLEYPLVFLPFASSFRAKEATDFPLHWHDERGAPRVSLSPDSAAAAIADQERLAEDLRKLYVALTRARYATWIGVAPIQAVERGPVGYLLGGGAPLSPAALRDAASGWAAACDAIVVRDLPEGDDTPVAQTPAPLAWRAEPALPAARAPWWVASYSALRQAESTAPVGTAGRLPPASADEDTLTECRAAEPSHGALAIPAAGSLHGLPRGAGPGTFLHQLLEWAGRQGFGRLARDPALLADADDLIARRCNLSGWSHWTETLQAWLRAWLRTPLDLRGLRAAFGAVAPAALAGTAIEMEFWLSTDAVDVQALDALVVQHTLDAQPRPALAPQRLNGMLKGFIDLVFEHQGCYFVADYKSNALGPGDAHYHAAALRDAVLAHRYDLQYVLYTLALHRLLRSRLTDYDYDRHIGGVVYLFLRGHAAAGQGLHLERPPRPLIEALDAMLAGAAHAQEHAR